MSLSEVTPELALPPATAVAEMRIAVPSYRLPVYIACTVLALITNYLLGNDVAWDTLNYHLYAGFGAVNDRFAQDYFAAGPQSYINPYAYAPYYGLVRSGMSSLAIGSVMAAVHSMILWLTFELAALACPSANSRTRLAFGSCAVALAFVNPILMQQLGSSFADITTAELVLAGWLLLAGAVRAPHAARILCAGVLLGAATALKPTNAVHALAGAAVLTLLSVPLRGRIRYGLAYAISGGLGFLMVAAPWSYRLERMFGNPFFPLMNGLFRSPEFTTEPLRHYRFIPETLTEALWRPFAMMDPVNMVHEELSAPDLRYAILVVLLIIWALSRLRRRVPQRDEAPTGEKPDPSARVLAALGCGLAVDWTIWLCNSGNSRYFLPMACVAAVVIVALLFRLFARRPKALNYVLCAIFGVQVTQLCMGTEYRWNAAPWGSEWLGISIPEKLSSETNLYLTIGIQSNSFLAPFLSRDSGMVNFSGGYTLGADGANGERIKRLIRRYGTHIRVLLAGERLYEPMELREPRQSRIDDALMPFGLRVDASDCATIAVHGLPPEMRIKIVSADAPSQPASQEPPQPPGDTTYLVTCRVIPDATDHSAQIAHRRDVELVLDRLEDACPQLFQPRRPATEFGGGAALRRYTNTDLTAWVSHDGVKFRHPIRGDGVVYVGRADDWIKEPQRLRCGRRNGHYFAQAIGSRDRP
jgi:hypothetical protein